MIVPAGNTAHFSVSYDDSYPYTQALANDVLARCEADLTSLANIFVGVPAPSSIKVTVTDGGAGAFHTGTDVTLHSSVNTDSIGIVGLLVEEVSEMFMSEQLVALGKGFNPGYSHGEGLSRVLAQELYPANAGRFSTGLAWLNTTRPDWVSATEPTDTNGVSFGCAELFLSYLRYQLGFTWQKIVAAADNELSLVAQNLGVQNAWNDFYAVLDRHYPVGTNVQPAQLPHDSTGRPIDNLFPLSCLYLRHNLADDGTTHGGPLGNSPDIIVKNSAVSDPQGTYSTPASIASDQESDADVIGTQNNYVYLRVWNLGAAATGVTATAYWSQVATLPTPSMWNEIGVANYGSVPAGRSVQVSVPGLTWAQADIPGPGHYCFIATVGDAGDPPPSPGNLGSFDDFAAYIATHDNITWRNFNVVNLDHWRIGAGGMRHGRLPFLITGAWDRARTFHLETHANLPQHTRAALHVPAHLGLRFRPALEGIEEYEDADAGGDDRPRTRIHLDAHGTRSLGAVELAAERAVPSHIAVEVPEHHHGGAHRIVVRQSYEGREVGRITWLLVS